MKDYHKAWLAAHPERSEAWLRECFRDGFDVHHLDGNHQNNDPANLVLIEHVDHMRIHAMPVVYLNQKKGKQRERAPRDWRRTTQHANDVRRAEVKRRKRAEILNGLALLD